MRFMLFAAVAALNLPAAVPPQTQGLAPGYSLTSHGCITNSGYQVVHPATAIQSSQLQATRFPPNDPRTRIAYDYARFPSAYYSYSARYYAARENYDEALKYYRLAIEEEAKENLTQGSKNSTRLTYSILLYRLHHVPEAKGQWRILAGIGSKNQDVPDAATRSALGRHFQQALVQLAMSPPNFNLVFRDSGAAYNLQRGLNAAASNDFAAAQKFLSYSLECDWFFPIPHLALGIIDAMNGDFRLARHEWIASLEGGEPDPPDTADIMGAQFDAIYLLLQFD